MIVKRKQRDLTEPCASPVDCLTHCWPGSWTCRPKLPCPAWRRPLSGETQQNKTATREQEAAFWSERAKAEGAEILCILDETRTPYIKLRSSSLKLFFLPAGLSSFPPKLTSTAELTRIPTVPFSAPAGSSRAGDERPPVSCWKYSSMDEACWPWSGWDAQSQFKTQGGLLSTACNHFHQWRQREQVEWL